MTDLLLIPAMKEAAERATPGDWTVDVQPEEADVSGNFIVSSVRETSDDGQHSWAKAIAGASCCCCGSGGVWEPEDAAHIALSSPKNVLALISVVEEARTVLEKAEKGCHRSDAEDDWQECIVCRGWINHYGHAKDCALVAALTQIRRTLNHD